MNKSGLDAGVLMQTEAEERSEGNAARGQEGEVALRTGGSRPKLEDVRCSPDPMHQTDRYRLVTPYLSSSRDL